MKLSTRRWPLRARGWLRSLWISVGPKLGERRLWYVTAWRNEWSWGVRLGPVVFGGATWRAIL